MIAKEEASSFAALMISSARHSEIVVFFPWVLATAPVVIFLNALSSRLCGAVSTAWGTEIPEKNNRMTSSRGAAFSIAVTSIWRGFFFVFFSMISNDVFIAL